jgi:ABC-type branched-subunit amino acid transport system ATPase component
MAERAGPAALEVRGLNVFYGASHALQGVDLRLERGALSVVGRNGMGKTTLCKAIMGLVPIGSGSISFRGKPLAGLTPAEIARLGVGYVPQGRRLWRSLTVDEHLKLVARSGGAWSIERIYSTFPRLAERRGNGGAQLSGGEQQMLAISRALLMNPQLLVMDEPTEGLAPVIVAQVEEMLVRLAEEGDIDVLVIEQNIGVACAIAETVAIMVNGRINRAAPARELAADRDLQQRLLGRAAGAGRADPHLHVEPVAADALVEARRGRHDRAQRQAADRPAGHGAGRAAGHPAAGCARRGGRARGGHARHQGRRIALHARHPARRGRPGAPGRPVDDRRAHRRRCSGPPGGRVSSARRGGRADR